MEPTTVPSLIPVSKRISSVFTPEVQWWNDDIIRWAEAYNLDPNIVAIIMQLESCGYQYALSSAGALGLFQVMPFHFNVTQDPYDPETNAVAGLGYFNDGMELFGNNLGLTFAGYNMGHHGVLTRYWPEETDRYYLWATGILSDIEQGLNPSPSLLDWYGKGRSTCTNAASELGLN